VTGKIPCVVTTLPAEFRKRENLMQRRFKQAWLLF
jgi:hypothetical protein